MYITRVHWCNNQPYECESTDTFIVGIYPTKKEAEEAINTFYITYKNIEEVTPLELHCGNYTFNAKAPNKNYPDTYEFEVDEIKVGKTYTNGF